MQEKRQRTGWKDVNSLFCFDQCSKEILHWFPSRGRELALGSALVL